MPSLNDPEEFGKKDDEETDGNDSGDDEFLTFTQLHGVRIIQSIVKRVHSAILICEIVLTSCDLGLNTSSEKAS